MSHALEMMWADVASTWSSITDWLDGLAGAPGAWVLPAVLLLVVILIVILLALLPGGRRERRVESKPELLVSRGEVRSFDESSVTELSMHVSNLGDNVAQLLEVALSSDLMPTPETVELSLIVARNSSVDVNLPAPELHGDSGFLDLYFYTPQTRKRAYRLRASLDWEPWNGRFKVDPLGQRIDPARRLASSRLQRRQRDDWRRRQRQLVEAEADPVALFSEPESETRSEEDEPVTRREKLEFPSDF